MTNRQPRRSVDIKLSPTDPDDTVYDLLKSNDLPTADLDAAAVTLFKVTKNDELIGIGGYEIHGTSALLRSLAVNPAARSEGYGTKICLELERRIAINGCDVVYLLTNDADGFFERIEFERIDRETAPAQIRGSREFAELCPSTAVCMGKNLSPK